MVTSASNSTLQGTPSNGNPATGQGSNSVNIRLFNERVILNALRRLGQASKADLSRYVSLTNNTAGVIVKELEERKLIRSEGKRSGGRGQPATLLSLDPDGAYAIGVKFGRRSIDTLLVDFRGHVLDRRHHELDFPMPDEAVGLALHDIAALRKGVPQGASARMAGIGIATPYDMGSWRRELDIASEAYRVWNEVDISSRIGTETGLPVFRDAVARVPYLDPDPVATAPAPDHHAALGGEPDRVADQVAQHAFQQCGVGRDDGAARHEAQAQTLRYGGCVELADQLFQYLVHRNLGNRRTDVARLQRRQFQQGREKRFTRLNRFLDAGHQRLLRWIVDLGLQQMEKQVNRLERLAEIMVGCREEPRLRPRRTLRFGTRRRQ